MIIPGGSVGLVLDAANGAMLDHRPNPAHIDRPLYLDRATGNPRDMAGTG